MKVNVKTIWGNGFVSIADKYVKQALDKNEGLTIEHTKSGSTMEVSYDKLKEMKPRDKKFKDRYSNGEYTLYDFWWEVSKD